MYLNFRYIKSTNESSSLKTRDLNGSITGKYYLNFGRENKFQKEDFSDLVREMVAIFKGNIGPISNDVTSY